MNILTLSLGEIHPYGKNPRKNDKAVDAVAESIRQFHVPYSSIYDMGYERTGCIFCMFGAHLDGSPNRFQRLQKTHPKLWRYCMRDWEAGGLGMRSVLEYIGIPYESFSV